MKSKVIKGKYGCCWEKGAGWAPDGSFCGECSPSSERKCARLRTAVLPCRIGDIVYRVGKRRGAWCVLPREVLSITYRLNCKHEVYWELFTTTVDVLGYSVFLTEEEADAEVERRKRNAVKSSNNSNN